MSFAPQSYGDRGYLHPFGAGAPAGYPKDLPRATKEPAHSVCRTVWYDVYATVDGVRVRVGRASRREVKVRQTESMSSVA